MKNIFRREKPDFAGLLNDGAMIIDVRTEGEFAGSHLKNSINIPLNELAEASSKLDKHIALILCCASGIRSSSAGRILKSKGFTHVYNGGSWVKLKPFEK